MTYPDTILKEVKFNADGLVPVIAQDKTTHEVLMMAWMDKDALLKTLETGDMHYYSRSRKSQWRKGESSGQTQILHTLTIDCDGDTLLAIVTQQGVACHTGRKTCFFKQIDGEHITITQEVVTSPETLYNKDKS